MEKTIIHLTKFSTIFSSIVMLSTFALFATSFEPMLVAFVYVTALLSFAVVGSKRAEIDAQAAQNAKIRFESLYAKFSEDLKATKDRNESLAKALEAETAQVARLQSAANSLRAEISSLRLDNQELKIANARLANEKEAAVSRSENALARISSIQAEYDSLISSNRQLADSNAAMRKELQDYKFTLDTERSTLEEVQRKYKSLVNSVNAKARTQKQVE